MHYSKEEKAKLLEGWKASGKSICAYVKEMGLIRWTFTKWLKADREREAGFVEVTAPAMPPSTCTPEIVIEKGDVKIHISVSLGCRDLRTVIEGLGAIL